MAKSNRSTWLKLCGEIAELNLVVVEHTAAVVDINEFIQGQERILVNRINAIEKQLSDLQTSPRSSIWDIAPVTKEAIASCLAGAEKAR